MILDYSKLIVALEAHTKALIDHAEALAKSAVGSVENAVKTRGRKAAGEAEGKAQTVTEVAATAAPTAVATQPASATAVTSASQPAPASQLSAEPKVVTQLTLQQVADAIIALANSPTGGRDKAVAILTKYGVKKVPELKPENFEAVLADVAAANAPSGAAGLM
jgi:CCR4-NOT transcriptional regulation complex NOT5 subunit